MTIPVIASFLYPELGFEEVVVAGALLVVLEAALPVGVDVAPAERETMDVAEALISMSSLRMLTWRAGLVLFRQDAGFEVVEPEVKWTAAH